MKDSLGNVRVCTTWLSGFLHVPIGVQHEVPLWCHSCFWMVVMVNLKSRASITVEELYEDREVVNVVGSWS
jgi:hypothetical protein